MKKIVKIIPLLMMIFIISLSFACAADADGQNITNDNVLSDNGQDTIVSSVDSDEPVKDTQENEIRVTAKTFSELESEINTAMEGSTLVLTDDCSYDSKITYDGIGIRKQITIDGNGHTINGKDSARAFVIDANNIILKNINFINGNSKGHGGGDLLIRASNTVIENCTFKNSEDAYGGAIYMNAYTKTDSSKEVTGTKINNCKFESNTATKNGGAIYALSKKNTITNSEFISNNAVMAGAIGANENSNNNYIASNKFISNYASDEAGAVALMYSSNQVVENNIFSKNIAGNRVGALDIYKGSDYTVTNNTFTSNNGGDLAGAMRLSILSSKTESKITENTFTDNKAKNGGALYSDSDNAQFTQNTFTSNEATEQSGGAIFINGNGNTISENTIDKCSASHKGGAISIEKDSNKILENTITNCHAENGGGAIFILGSKNTINQNTTTPQKPTEEQYSSTETPQPLQKTHSPPTKQTQKQAQEEQYSSTVKKTQFQKTQLTKAMPATKEEQSASKETPTKYSKTPLQTATQKTEEEQSSY